MCTIEEEARIALAAKGKAEQDLARVAHCPPWRHALFAAVMATLVATPEIAPPLRFGVLAMVCGAIALIVQSDRRRLGVFINGYRRGKTRLVTFPMLAVIFGLYSASTYYGVGRHQPAISFAIAAVSFVISYFGSVLWQKVFKHELGL